MITRTEVIDYLNHRLQRLLNPKPGMRYVMEIEDLHMFYKFGLQEHKVKGLEMKMSLNEMIKFISVSNPQRLAAAFQNFIVALHEQYEVNQLQKIENDNIKIIKFV